MKDKKKKQEIIEEQEEKTQAEETTDMITAEDLVEQAIYSMNTPDCCRDEQAENMLGMLGANIIDTDIYHNEENCPQNYEDEFSEEQLVEKLKKYPSLKIYTNDFADLVDHYVDQAVESQLDGYAYLNYESMKEYFGADFDEDLFFSMMVGRPEIEDIDYAHAGYNVQISEDYLAPQRELKVLDENDVEIMIASHTLWLNDCGSGEQANFTNCRLTDINLKGKNLCNANFNGAVLENCNLEEASLCFANLSDARFYNCVMENMDAEECNVVDARFYNCHMPMSYFTHSNCYGAKFVDSYLSESSFKYCCIENTDFGQAYTPQIDFSGTSENEEEWLEQGGIQEIKPD